MLSLPTYFITVFIQNWPIVKKRYNMPAKQNSEAAEMLSPRQLTTGNRGSITGRLAKAPPPHPPANRLAHCTSSFAQCEQTHECTCFAVKKEEEGNSESVYLLMFVSLQSHRKNQTERWLGGGGGCSLWGLPPLGVESDWDAPWQGAAGGWHMRGSASTTGHWSPRPAHPKKGAHQPPTCTSNNVSVGEHEKLFRAVGHLQSLW